MSFKFNFGVSEDGENVTTANVATVDLDSDSHAQDQDQTVAPFSLVPLAIPHVSSIVVDAIYYKDNKLWKRQIDDVQFQLAQQDTMEENETEGSNAIQQAMAQGNSASDVIKGVYEGGLKTWECSIDLLNYLVAHGGADSSLSLAGANVLEIGCGTALPSLHILKTEPSSHVCMQDYNRDVLELVTVPNVLANTVLRPEDPVAGDKMFTEDDTETCEIDVDFRRTHVLFGSETDQAIGQRNVPELTTEEWQEADAKLLASSSIADRCEFIAGDWTKVEEQIRKQGRENTFNLVLTSETIYETASYRKLHDLLACVLAKPAGSSASSDAIGRVPVVLVAAKSIYFGLTGSVLSFRQY
ncbi:hypothetical protein GGI12_005558, partial [Dipsacomyces acuminosporus]